MPKSGVAASEDVSPSHRKRSGRKSKTNTCSSPKTLGKNSTPGSPGKNHRLKEPRKNSTSGGEQSQHCTSQQTDDVPQHFKQPDRSLHPASACIGNAPYRQRPPTSTDETRWNHISCIEGTRWKPIRSPRRFDQNWIITRISASCCWVHVRCHMGCTHFAHTVQHTPSFINLKKRSEWKRQ